MDELRVLPALLEDAPAILKLQRRAYQSEAQLYNDWSIAPLTQTLAELTAEFRSSVVLKAVSRHQLLGSVRGKNDSGVVHIGRLIVEPAAQRRGIGSKLLLAIELAFPGARSFELFTGSRSTGNIELYKRHGYRITHEKLLTPGVNLVFMLKPNAAA
jgi:ribosomal protein S18 acetylase RimI-like enzyme